MTRGQIAGVIAIAVLPVAGFFGYRALGSTQVFERLDEQSADTDAAIALSDPLLYARETLINDRRREYEFLTDLLGKSADPAKVQFAPQINRDIAALTTLSTETSAKLNSLNSAEAKPSSPSGQDQNRPASPSTDKLQYSPSEEFRDRQAYRSELRAALASVNLDDRHDFAGNALFRLQFKASIFPGEQKNKYGVARLTLVPPKIGKPEVDEIYLTWIGHLSSRLNVFDAQRNLVVDGRYESAGVAPRFAGIQRIAVGEASIDPKSDACLGTEQAAERPPPATISLPFNVAAILLPLNCRVFAVAVGPDDPPLVKKVFADRSDVQLLSLYDQLNGADRDYFKQSTCSDLLKRDKFRQTVETAGIILKVMPNLTAALNGVVVGNSSLELGGAQDERSNDFLNLRGKYQRLGEQAARIRDYIRGLELPAKFILSLVPDLTCAHDIQEKLPRSINLNDIATSAAQPPEAFAAALIDKDTVVQGQAYGLGTAPSELGQRLTTTARAAASLNMALALQAARQEAELRSSTEFARNATQTAAELERVPLVVGFSDRNGAGPAPQFGWVFGPHVKLDKSGSGFAFEQSVAAYDVSADVSVPSWWPKLDFELETAWVGNWYNKLEVLPQVPDDKKTAAGSSNGHRHKSLISVPLPLNRADLDGLTKFLIRRAFGATQELTTIRLVEPSAISACGNKATFLIYGANIWRDADAFLGGVEAEHIDVLPDMEGIAATFDLGKLLPTRKNSAKSPLGYEEVALRVNTRNGSDGRPVRVMGQRVQTDDCDSPFNVTTPIVPTHNELAPIVFEISSSTIQACTEEAVLVVTGRHLLSSEGKQQIATKFYLGSAPVVAELLGPNDRPGAAEVVKLSAKMNADLRQTGKRIPLVAANPNGMVNMWIDIVPCSQADAAPPAVPSAAPKRQ